VVAAAIFMRAVLKVLGVRIIEQFGLPILFEGLPAPDPENISDRVKSTLEPADDTHVQTFRGVGQEVRRNFAAFGMLDERVKFLQGWFKDTLPQHR